MSRLSETETQALVRAAQASGGTALEALLLGWRPFLVQEAARFQVPGHTVADLVQEASLQLQTKLPSYDASRPNGFGCWAGKVARNRWIDLARAETQTQRRAPLNQAESLDQAAAGLALSERLEGPALDPAAIVVRQEGHRQLLDWVESHLTGEERRIIAALMEGRPMSEVGEELGVTKSAVRQRRDRILARLKAQLAQAGILELLEED